MRCVFIKCCVLHINRADGLSVQLENLCWLVKTRCVLFSSYFLQGKLSGPLANPVLAGKNLIGGAKVIRFYNQIGGGRNPAPPHTLPWHAQTGALLQKCYVLHIGSAASAFCVYRKCSKTLRFWNLWVFGGSASMPVFSKAMIIQILVRIVYFIM